jgi:hypothetical protein
MASAARLCFGFVEDSLQPIQSAVAVSLCRRTPRNLCLSAIADKLNRINAVKARKVSPPFTFYLRIYRELEAEVGSLSQ